MVFKIISTEPKFRNWIARQLKICCKFVVKGMTKVEVVRTCQLTDKNIFQFTTRAVKRLLNYQLISLSLKFMERLPVSSSMAKSIGHDPFQSILEIEFTSGEVWQYLDVPHDVYKEMLTFSIGKYFQAFIKGRYEERRIQ